MTRVKCALACLLLAGVTAANDSDGEASANDALPDLPADMQGELDAAQDAEPPRYNQEFRRPDGGDGGDAHYLDVNDVAGDGDAPEPGEPGYFAPGPPVEDAGNPEDLPDVPQAGDAGYFAPEPPPVTDPSHPEYGNPEHLPDVEARDGDGAAGDPPPPGNAGYGAPLRVGNEYDELPEEMAAALAETFKDGTPLNMFPDDMQDAMTPGEEGRYKRARRPEGAARMDEFPDDMQDAEQDPRDGNQYDQTPKELQDALDFNMATNFGRYQTDFGEVNNDPDDGRHYVGIDDVLDADAPPPGYGAPMRVGNQYDELPDEMAAALAEAAKDGKPLNAFPDDMQDAMSPGEEGRYKRARRTQGAARMDEFPDDMQDAEQDPADGNQYDYLPAELRAAKEFRDFVDDMQDALSPGEEQARQNEGQARVDDFPDDMQDAEMGEEPEEFDDLQLLPPDAPDNEIGVAEDPYAAADGIAPAADPYARADGPREQYLSFDDVLRESGRALEDASEDGPEPIAADPNDPYARADGVLPEPDAGADPKPFDPYAAADGVLPEPDAGADPKPFDPYAAADGVVPEPDAGADPKPFDPYAAADGVVPEPDAGADPKPFDPYAAADGVAPPVDADPDAKPYDPYAAAAGIPPEPDADGPGQLRRQDGTTDLYGDLEAQAAADRAAAADAKSDPQPDRDGTDSSDGSETSSAGDAHDPRRPSPNSPGDDRRPKPRPRP